MRELLREADWIGLEDALQRMLQSVQALPAEEIDLSDALGRILAADVRASVDLPPWDNSAMDGFAVRSSDITGATRAHPVRLQLIESVQAGAFATRAVANGQTIKIMTGAPVPAGADSVVRVEHTTLEDDVVVVFNDSDARRNIRPRGEDVRKDEVAVGAGTPLRPGEIGLLASIGQARLRVHCRPRVAILSTGDELVDVTHFDEVLAGRRIVNSNSYALAAAVRAVGAEPVVLGIARDDETELRLLLERGLQHDVLVTSAGASVGEHDLVKDVLERLGARTEFWRVRIRPGSPFSFAMSGDVPVFGLPGNPVSAVVTFEILVKPALRKMLGRRTLFAPVVDAQIREPIANKTGLTQFLRVHLKRESGTWIARLTGPQGSGILSSVAHADGLLVLPENMMEQAAGADVKVVLLTSPDEAQTDLGFQTRKNT